MKTNCYKTACSNPVPFGGLLCKLYELKIGETFRLNIYGKLWINLGADKMNPNLIKARSFNKTKSRSGKMIDKHTHLSSMREVIVVGCSPKGID